MFFMSFGFLVGLFFMHIIPYLWSSVDSVIGLTDKQIHFEHLFVSEQP
jgi:hypothetical protein